MKTNLFDCPFCVVASSSDYCITAYYLLFVHHNINDRINTVENNMIYFADLRADRGE
jgi:hypothetical protein